MQKFVEINVMWQNH